jgi:D-alanyl-lipoteichoic acid acyltransferase DltB (MBOAT superfamily)
MHTQQLIMLLLHGLGWRFKALEILANETISQYRKNAINAKYKPLWGLQVKSTIHLLEQN